jgi:small nuclear ribonucleoprotein (snRNP)-like protein
MLKKTICLLLCALIVVPSFAQMNNKQLEKETKFKQRIVEWGMNKNVSIKLKSGEKLDGRISEIKDDLFAVQFMQKDKVTSREINYSEVNKISGKDGGKAGKIVGYTALGVLAGVGVIFLVVLGVWARN